MSPAENSREVTWSGVGRRFLGSTHFPRTSFEAREQATDRMLRLVHEIEDPWIVCGDFNQASDQTLRGRSLLVEPESVPTYPTSDPIESIDYAIASGVEISGSVLVEGDAADHLPIVIEADSTAVESGISGR